MYGYFAEKVHILTLQEASFIAQLLKPRNKLVLPYSSLYGRTLESFRIHFFLNKSNKTYKKAGFRVK